MAAENFDQAVSLTLSFEGGYSDHPLDPGGATNRGITLATLARHRGKPVSKSEVMALTEAEARAIYRASYWNAVSCDALPAGLDLAMFDFAVNSGPARAIAALSALLGQKGRSTIDQAMLDRLKSADCSLLARQLCRKRLGFLQGLKIFPTFGRGWTRRVEAVSAAAAALASKVPAPTPGNDPKDTSMTGTKTLLESRTVWANIVGLMALLLGSFGFDLAGIDQSKLTDAICQVVAGASFIASSIFRLLARKAIA